MNLNFTLDPKVRCIVLFQDAKWSAYRIAQVLKKPERTVRDWILKLEAGINIMEIQSGRGRKSTSETIKERIIKDARRKPSTASTRALGAKHSISKNTAHKVFREKNWTYFKITPKIELTEKNKKDRVQFCKNMLKRKGQDLEEAFFSDEMGVTLSDTLTIKTWSGPQKKVKIDKPLADVKVNCWGAISKNGATSLEIYRGNLKADRYQVIVQNHVDEMEELCPSGVKFIHDNSSVHKASENNLRNSNFQLIKFPEYSPDLNPIENLWSSLKQRVSHDAPKTERQLISSLQKNWEILTEPENLFPYFENLSDRFNECIQKNGIRLPY